MNSYDVFTKRRPFRGSFQWQVWWLASCVWYPVVLVAPAAYLSLQSSGSTCDLCWGPQGWREVGPISPGNVAARYQKWWALDNVSWFGYGWKVDFGGEWLKIEWILRRFVGKIIGWNELFWGADSTFWTLGLRSVWGIIGMSYPRVLPKMNWVVCQIDGPPTIPKQDHAKGCLSLVALGGTVPRNSHEQNLFWLCAIFTWCSLFAIGFTSIQSPCGELGYFLSHHQNKQIQVM